MKQVKYGIWYLVGNYWCQLPAGIRKEYHDINEAYNNIQWPIMYHKIYEVREIKEE